MFVGHTALALAAKARAPETSLGALLAASMGLDLLWPALLFAGVEKVRIDPGNTAFTPLAFDHYPWSHSLVAALVWGAVAAAIAAWRGSPRRNQVVLGLLVVSHWVLDWVTHRPDLPLWPGASPLCGLRLWDSVAATFAVEGALFAAGIVAYGRATRPRDRLGSVALAGLLLLSAAIWVSGPFSPPPPGPGSVAVVTCALWLLVAWAAWIDRHREARP